MSSLTAAPTVASLSASLGAHLAPVGALPLPSRPVTAVHISELLDPSAYLAGGELLLTLGISLPDNLIGCRRYVSALGTSNVSAVALGLGPVFDTVPQPLIDACVEHDLPLLQVPARTPFLTVTKAYWSALARSNEQHLSDAIATHRALVDAALSPEPVVNVLKRLARWLDGWAATLDQRGRLEEVYPTGYRDRAEALEVEVSRIQGAGVHTSASFAEAGSVVVVLPLAVEDEVVGYLAVGTGGKLDTSQRAVVLSASGLLSLEAARSRGTLSVEAALRQGIALLIDDGHLAAADRLTARLGHTPLSRRCRVMTIRGKSADFIAAAVRDWCPQSLGVTLDRFTAWFVVPSSHPELSDLLDVRLGTDASRTAVVSDLAPLRDVASIRAGQLARLMSLLPGQIDSPAPTVDDLYVAAKLDQLLDAGPQIVQATAAYLRHHGQWETAARDLGVHRNTLRYRIGRARTALKGDLLDPDLSARLWLLMRERGLA